MSVPNGYIRLRCSKPKYDQLVLIGQTPPKITGGVGGWETVDRPRQTSMTVWGGNEPYGLELDVLFEGYGRLAVREQSERAILRTQGGRSQEPAIRELLQAARGDEESEPSTWTIDGVPWLPADEWVLNGAEPGDTVLRRDDFSRVRQAYQLSFLEYVPPEYAKVRGKALQGVGPSTSYRVKKGDTPASIARKRRIHWTVLRTLNPKGKTAVKTANQKLKEGTRLRVPILKAPAKKKARK